VHGAGATPDASAPSTAQALRRAYVAEARTWISTPFVHQGDVRGVGVDCLMLIVRGAQAAGCLGDIPDPRPYPRMWAARDGRYLDSLAPHVVPQPGTPEPGDIALFRMGRAPCHAAIVIAWPLVIHAIPERGVCETDAFMGDTPGPFVCAVTPRAIAEAV
jgi:cell wall-associated NlpC family hydrolase